MGTTFPAFPYIPPLYNTQIDPRLTRSLSREYAIFAIQNAVTKITPAPYRDQPFRCDAVTIQLAMRPQLAINATQNPRVKVGEIYIR